MTNIWMKVVCKNEGLLKVYTTNAIIIPFFSPHMLTFRESQALCQVPSLHSLELFFSFILIHLGRLYPHLASEETGL